MLSHPVPAGVLGLLGEVVVCFAMLESELQAFVTALIREHQRLGQILTSYFTFDDLCAAVLSLYRDRYQEDEDYRTLKELITRAGKIEEERNRLFHSIWAAGDTLDNVTRVKITARQKHGFKAEFERYDTGRLEAFVTEMKQVVESLFKLRVRLIAASKLVNNPAEKLW